MTQSLHPQSDRAGSGHVPPGHEHFRLLPVFVLEDGDEKHETPLCPEIQGKTHYSVCQEEAIYVYGERWCETCRHYSTDLDRDDSWTDPRHRRSDSDD